MTKTPAQLDREIAETLNPSGGWGVFSDEGQISGPFFSFTAAEAARIQDDPDGESDLVIRACCHDHPEQPADGCEECDNDDDER
jgi:hypothetical protein